VQKIEMGLNVKCSVCGNLGTLVKPFESPSNNVEWLRCAECRIIFADRHVTAETLIDYYKDYYNAHNLDVPQVAILSLEKTIRSFDKYRSKGNTICDIGFGAGTFLDATQKAGWNCSGTEY
jgi:hypothetical protein